MMIVVIAGVGNMKSSYKRQRERETKKNLETTKQFFGGKNALSLLHLHASCRE